MEKHGEIKLTTKVVEKLFSISAATIDRLLALTRKKQQIKESPLLNKQASYNTKSGFFKVDLVSHDGGNSKGHVIQSLNFTDIATCWCEMTAVKNKAHKWLFGGIKQIKERPLFAILGFDSDNGSEFINCHLIRYCEEQHITFTRSRPYRKNDSCYIEQKNWSVIRRTVGYGRHNTDKELRLLNKLYGYLRLYVNFFQPVRRLVQKERIGSRIKKRYDVAKTPYRRVLASSYIPEEIKMKLERQYAMLNPAELKREITKIQNQLYKSNILKQNQDKETVLSKKAQNSFDYIST